MTRKITLPLFAVSVVLALSIGAYLHLSDPLTPDASQALSETGQKTQTTGVGDTSVASSASDSLDTETVIPTGESPETEIVMGIEVRKDRNCTIEVHYIDAGDGTVREAYSCTPNSPAPKHPYESYSSEALMTLSYADAKAAEVLGMRLREIDHELAMSLVIRASALSGGDVSPIQTYSNAYPIASAINGVPVKETIKVKYVLSAVAELLGAEHNNQSVWRDEVLQAFDNPVDVIREFDDRAIEIVQEMQNIESEVLGHSSIRLQRGI